MGREYEEENAWGGRTNGVADQTTGNETTGTSSDEHAS